MRITAAGMAQPQIEAPDPILRPTLALWMWERGLDYRAAGRLFGCSHTQVVIICKPFDDADRRRPKVDLLERIVRVTQGAITAADFYPPHLRAPVPAAGAIEELDQDPAARHGAQAS